MSNALLEIGRLTVGQGVKQAVSVSKELGDAKDMTKVRKAPVPGYRWSKPDEPTSMEGGDKFALFGMKTESERNIEKQIADREQAFAQRLADNRDQYNQQVKQGQDSVQAKRRGQVWDARKELWGANVSNAADKVRGVGRVATGVVRTPASWLTGFAVNGLTGARAAVADSRQETERLLIGDPNREMAARMGLEQAKAEAAKPMPVAPPPPELQVPNSFKPVPTTPEAAREMYKPRPKFDVFTNEMYGGETIQKPKLGPAPLPALPAPPALPKQPAIPGSLRTTVSTPAEAIRARDATGPGPIKPLPPISEKSGMHKQANPLKVIANLVANAYKARSGVQAASKTQAGVRAAIGALGAGAGYAATPHLMPEGTDPSTLRNKRIMNMIVFGLGAGGYKPKLMAYTGLGSNVALGQLERLTLANEAQAKAQVAETAAATGLRQAETEAANMQAGASKQMRNAAAIISAGIIGATGYKIWRDRQKDMQRKGTIRVTLPTRRVGDTESTVDMPLNVLSNEAYKGIMRDTRRRVRAENTERIQRKALPAMQAGADMYDSFATPA